MNFTAIFCCYVLLPYFASLVSPPNEAITCNAGFWDVVRDIGLQTGILYWDPPLNASKGTPTGTRTGTQTRTTTTAQSCSCDWCKQSADKSRVVWRDITINDWNDEDQDQESYRSDDDTYEERGTRNKERPVNRNTSLRNTSMNKRRVEDEEDEEDDEDEDLMNKYAGIQSAGNIQKKPSFRKMPSESVPTPPPATGNVEKEDFYRGPSRRFSFRSSGNQSKKGGN